MIIEADENLPEKLNHVIDYRLSDWVFENGIWKDWRNIR